MNSFKTQLKNHLFYEDFLSSPYQNVSPSSVLPININYLYWGLSWWFSW